MNLPENAVLIPGYVDYYCNHVGEIFSHKWGVYKKLSPFITKKGYQRVCLSVNGKVGHESVHRLIMRAFREFSDLPVNHIDGNKLNNNLCNLEYVTHRENICHKSLLNKGTPGLSRNKNGKWQVQIFIGVFSDKQEAFEIYQKSLQILNIENKYSK